MEAVEWTVRCAVIGVANAQLNKAFVILNWIPNTVKVPGSVRCI